MTSASYAAVGRLPGWRLEPEARYSCPLNLRVQDKLAHLQLLTGAHAIHTQLLGCCAKTEIGPAGAAALLLPPPAARHLSPAAPRSPALPKRMHRSSGADPFPARRLQTDLGSCSRHPARSSFRRHPALVHVATPLLTSSHRSPTAARLQARPASVFVGVASPHSLSSRIRYGGAWRLRARPPQARV